MNDFTKKPHIKTEYTESQLKDLIQSQDDPLYFIESFIKVQHPKYGSVPLILYPFQHDLIRAFHENDKAVALTARQMGKTTVASSYLLWRAMFCPDTKILIAANKLRTAIEVMDRIRYSYEECPDYIKAGVTEFNKTSITFDNGSKIEAVATTPDAARGKSLTLLYLDEFAFVPGNMASAFWTAVQPTLSTGGACIITSTPRTDEDQFAQIWKGAQITTDEFGNPTGKRTGENDFFAISVPWFEHPERDEEWARPFRASLGRARFAQEFECKFVTDEETLIEPMCLARLKTFDPISYTGQIRWFIEPVPNRSYMIALDPSLGTGGDFAAIQVFMLPELIQVAEWQHNETDIRGQVRIMLQLLHTLQGELLEHPEQFGEPDLHWTVENNSIGEAILQVIEDTGEEKFPGQMVNEKKKKGKVRKFRKGLTTTNASKLSSCARLKSLVESDRMIINSQQALRELKGFVARGSSYAAKPGEHDDLVSALLLITRMLDIIIAMGLDCASDDLKETIAENEIFSEPMPVVL